MKSLEVRLGTYAVSQQNSRIRIFYSFSAIPIVAEDTYLQWLDQLFTTIDSQKSWTLWRELLRKFDLSHLSNGDEGHIANGETVGALDDIFDANEANIFGETLFVCFKCYEYLLKRIDTATETSDMDKATLKANVAREFAMLADF